MTELTLGSRFVRAGHMYYVPASSSGRPFKLGDAVLIVRNADDVSLKRGACMYVGNYASAVPNFFFFFFFFYSRE